MQNYGFFQKRFKKMLFFGFRFFKKCIFALFNTYKICAELLHTSAIKRPILS